MHASPGQRIRHLDPLRRVAILLIGATATLVTLGPVYGSVCGSYLSTGETGEGLLICQLVPFLIGAPIAGLTAGTVAGLVGRGHLDWILLLAGVVAGGVAGALVMASWSLTTDVVLVVLVTAAIAYGIVRGVRRVRGPAEVRPAWTAALALVMAVIAVSAAVISGGLPRERGARGSAGLATVRLDNPPGVVFSGRVACTFVTMPDRLRKFYGESLDWPAAGLTVSLSIDDRAGWEPSIRIDLPPPWPVESGAMNRVAYQAHIEASTVTGPPDGSRGRFSFTGVPQMVAADHGGGWPSEPVAAMPRTVSGTVEWDCSEAAAPKAEALPTRTPRPPAPPTPTLGPVVTNVRVQVEAATIAGVPDQGRAGVVELEIVSGGAVEEPLFVDIVGPMRERDVDLLKAGDLSWHDDYYFGRGEGTIDWSHAMATGPQAPFRTVLAPGRYGFFVKRFVSGTERVEAYALLTLAP